MKTNSISFGTTYLKPTIRYMSKENRQKLRSIYPLGQLYPVDIFIGADKRGNMTLDIKQSFIYDYLIQNDQFELTPQNISMYKFYKALNNSYKNIHGDNTPVRKATIENLDYITEDVLPYYVATEIEEYTKTQAKKFYC